MTALHGAPRAQTAPASGGLMPAGVPAGDESSAARAEGNAAADRAGLAEILVTSLEMLAAAGQRDAACRLAGRACAVLRRSDPVTWNRFNVLLHRLTRRVPI